MNVKEFAILAVQHGVKTHKIGEPRTPGGLCEGWDWIRQNIIELDNIFQSEEYKKSECYLTVKLNILTKGIEGLTEVEKEALHTTVYLQSERERNERREAYRTKMLNEGFIPLTYEVVTDAINKGKKIHLVAKHTNDWLTTRVEETYKPGLFKQRDGSELPILMKPKARSRGYSLYQFEEAYCKLV